jgi:hypothetical protein
MKTYYLVVGKQNVIFKVIQQDDGSTHHKRIDPANTDYANFKKEVLAGAELQDADGNVMTQAEADAFIATLP